MPALQVDEQPASGYSDMPAGAEPGCRAAVPADLTAQDRLLPASPPSWYAP